MSQHMTHPSSDDDGDSDRPPAKKAKVFRACAQCVSAKTRCEDVKPKGCWLCRRKSKECSLAGAVIPEQSRQSQGFPPPHLPLDRDGGDSSRRSSLHPPGPLGFRSAEGQMGVMGRGNGASGMDGNNVQLAHAEARITASEERIAALERELRDLRTVLPSPQLQSRLSIPNPDTISRTGSFAPPAPGTSPQSFKVTHLARFAQLEDFSETVFSLSSPDAYPSVVSAGILQQAEVNVAFQSFKHYFTAILPLSPYLSISTQAPQQNFVILACLHHVPAYASARLAKLVDESIITALSGNVRIDVVLAFLILALAPAIPLQRGMAARPSPLRLISLAYQIGRDLGLDGKVQGYLERGGDLAEPHWAEPMQVVQLWTAVVNRYMILHLLHGHGRPLPTSPASLIPDSPHPNVQQTTDHLRDEHRLARAATKAMQPLVAVEAGRHDFADVKQSMLEFQTAMADLTAWKRSGGSPALDYDQGCLEHIAVSRLSFLFQRIPSPLQPIRQTLIAGMSIFVVTAERFLATLFPDTSPPLDTSMMGPQFLRPLSSHTTSNNSFSSYSSPQAPSPSDATAAPDPRFPAHVSMCATLAVLSLRGTAAHMRHIQEVQNEVAVYLPLERVLRAERYLRSLGGAAEVAVTQADEAFGSLEEMMRWQSQVEQGRSATALLQPLAGGGTGSWNGGGQAWEHGENALLNSGLFDFDLFSWDPNFLAPDWMPGPTPGPQT